MNRIEEEYRDMLSHIEPGESFEQDLLKYLTDMQKQPQKTRTPIGKKIFLKQVYQMGMAGVVCICLVLIGTLTPVSATILDVYQRFYHSVTKNYGRNVQADEIAIEKEVFMKDGSQLYIDNAVLTNQGMSLHYKLQKKGNYEEVYPGEITLKLQKGMEIVMEQETYMPVSEKDEEQEYLATFQCSNSKQVEEFIHKKTQCTMVFLGETGEEVKEEQIQVTFTPFSIYQLKTLSSNKDWVYNNEKDISYRIQEVVIDAWYMKVEYQWQSKENQHFFAFELTDENKKEYISLGAVENQQKGNIYSATIFFELTDEDTKKMKFRPVWIKEGMDNQQIEEKITGKGITVTKGE